MIFGCKLMQNLNNLGIQKQYVKLQSCDMKIFFYTTLGFKNNVEMQLNWDKFLKIYDRPIKKNNRISLHQKIINFLK